MSKGKGHVPAQGNPIPVYHQDLVRRVAQLERDKAGMNEKEACAQSLLGAGGFNQASLANSPGKPDYVGQVGRLLSELSTLQDATHNLLDEIGKAFEPVLVPSVPTAAGTPIGTSPIMCGAGDTLLNRIRVQQTIIQRLKDLLERNAL